MQHQKAGCQVSRCSVCAEPQRHTAKYNTSAGETVYVGVKVKINATAVSNEALLYFSVCWMVSHPARVNYGTKTPASDIADGVKEV